MGNTFILHTLESIVYLNYFSDLYKYCLLYILCTLDITCTVIVYKLLKIYAIL